MRRSAALFCDLLSSLVVSMLMLMPTVASAADVPQTMLVIDGSGSMWGRLDPDKRAKIDIIREHLQSKIVAAGAQPIGLTSYGHRRKSDCSDVEILSAPDVDHTVASEALAKLNPRGKGPLVAALREAVAGLGPQRPASLIVVNDGVDNCRQDSCAAAAEIAASSPDVRIHMISIGIDAAEQPRLTCVAQATGGTFHDVTDSTSLIAALDAATALAMLTPNTAPLASQQSGAPVAVAATDAGLYAAVALAEGGDAIALPIHWRIFKAGGSDVLAESDGPTVTAKLDPGSYDIDAEYQRIRIKQSVTIEAGRAARIVVPLNAGRLKVSAKSTNAPQPTIGDTSALLLAVEPIVDGKPQADRTILAHKNAFSEILPSGAYTVTLMDGAISQSKSITLAAGSETTVDFALNTGRIELSAGLREDGGAIEDVTFTISEDDPDSPDGRRDVARSRAPTPSFTLPAGTYYASARSGDGEVRQRIAVGAGDVVKRALILPLVPVKVSALIGDQVATVDQGIAYRITALDGDRREIVRSVKSELDLSLLPGRYRISAHLDAHHLKVAEEITVEAGKSLEVMLKFLAGEVSFKPGAGLPAGANDTYWEILDAQGKPVWRAMAAEATAFLVPGRYTVHFARRDQHTEAAFEIRSGERKVVQVGAN